jgi:hypothetical protein
LQLPSFTQSSMTDSRILYAVPSESIGYTLTPQPPLQCHAMHML